MSAVHLCIYIEKCSDPTSSKFGFLTERKKKLNSFSEAVTFARKISNTNPNIIGRPIVQENNS
jgi:hypothetical protein